MKKCIFILAGLATLFVSCRKEEIEVQKISVPETLYATLEGESKAGFNYNSSLHTYSHFWEDGDRIWFFPKNNSASQYSCSDAGAGAFGWVSDSGDPVSYSYSYNYAVFPASLSIGAGVQNNASAVASLTASYDTGIPVTSTGALNVIVPKTEEFNPNANTLGYGNIMVARSEDNHLEFKNCLGWLKLQLKGYAPITGIKVESNSGQILSGAASIAFDGSGNPVLSMDNDCDAAASYKEITLSSSLYLDDYWSTSFYFPLPPMTLNGITVTITFENGLTQTISTNKSITVKRNSVTPMATREMPIPTAQLVSGPVFNATLKKMVHGNSADENTEDCEIKNIRFSMGSSAPAPPYQEVQAEGSPYKVYAKVSAGGIRNITLYSEAYRLQLDANCEKMFYNMQEVDNIDLLHFLAPSVLTDSRNMFANCYKLPNFNYVGGITLSGVHTGMFRNCILMDNIDFIRLETQTPTDLTAMLAGCVALTDVNLREVDLSAVTSLDSLCYGCTRLNRLEFGPGGGGRTLTNVSMQSICSGCTALTDFRLNLAASVTNLAHAFEGSTSIATVGLNSVTNAGDCSLENAFYGCTRLSVLALSVFECSNVDHAFYQTGSEVDSFHLLCKNETEYNKLKATASDWSLPDNKVSVVYSQH